MGSDPEPIDSVFDVSAERPIMSAHADRPEIANFLEMQRRVPGI